MDFTGLGDFSIHTVADTIQLTLYHSLIAHNGFNPHYSRRMLDCNSLVTLSLVTLINPQSDNGKHTLFPCCVVSVFTDCLATVVSRAALLPDVFTGVVRQRCQVLFTAS
jgi:hypothetical protein